MSTWEESAWAMGRRDEERRNLKLGLAISAALHLGLVLAMGVFSMPRSVQFQSAVTVDLVASLPAAAAPAPKAAPKPKPVAVAPPPPKQKVRVLPKNPAPATRKPTPAPVKPKELEYEDALAKLRAEQGEPTPEAAAAEPAASPAPAVAQAGGSSSGRRVDAEVAAWVLAARSHVRARYVTPPQFLNRGLVTELLVRLSGSGVVIGTPEVVRTSGDPYWDDNAVRAIMRSSPLPAPPEAGAWAFTFPTEDR